MHILSVLHPSIALADYIKAIKVSTSVWLKQSGDFPAFTNWSKGYAASKNLVQPLWSKKGKAKKLCVT
ncbi:MAG: transposase [Bacteroidales bacterium]|nr:transposase [Bacteroidales bacterium]